MAELKDKRLKLEDDKWLDSNRPQINGQHDLIISVAGLISECITLTNVFDGGPQTRDEFYDDFVTSSLSDYKDDDFKAAVKDVIQLIRVRSVNLYMKRNTNKNG